MNGVVMFWPLKEISCIKKKKTQQHDITLCSVGVLFIKKKVKLYYIYTNEAMGI